MTELVPSSEWNSVWIIAVVAFSTIGFYAVSERNANPMLLRTGRAGQTPFVSNTCRDTERAVTGLIIRAGGIGVFWSAAEKKHNGVRSYYQAYVQSSYLAELYRYREFRRFMRDTRRFMGYPRRFVFNPLSVRRVMRRSSISANKIGYLRGDEWGI